MNARLGGVLERVDDRHVSCPSVSSTPAMPSSLPERVAVGPNVAGEQKAIVRADELNEVNATS